MGVFKALEGSSKLSSTKDILGKDIDTYRKWIEHQRFLEIKWINIAIDHVKPIYLFDVSRVEELREAFDWKNNQPSLQKSSSA